MGSFSNGWTNHPRIPHTWGAISAMLIKEFCICEKVVRLFEPEFPVTKRSSRSRFRLSQSSPPWAIWRKEGNQSSFPSLESLVDKTTFSIRAIFIFDLYHKNVSTHYPTRRHKLLAIIGHNSEATAPRCRLVGRANCTSFVKSQAGKPPIPIPYR